MHYGHFDRAQCSERDADRQRRNLQRLARLSLHINGLIISQTDIVNH